HPVGRVGALEGVRLRPSRWRVVGAGVVPAAEWGRCDGADRVGYGCGVLRGGAGVVMTLLADRLAHPLGRRFLTPLDFDENLMGWWDASKLRLDDNDPVATWPDLSGNGLDFTAQTANPPVFAARAYNGR